MRIQDVAKKANVGVGTVSRVLNGSGYVSKATEEKVLQAIKELNYTPNELARNLLHKKTNTIAVIVPDISNPFYSSLVNEIEKDLRIRGYKTLLCNTAGEKTNEKIYLDMLQRNMVDGVLTATHSLDSKQYQDIDGPVVSFDTPRLSPASPVITVDHKEGGRIAAQALLDAGCRHVVQFRDNVSRKFPYFDRHEEFERVITEAGAVCKNCITSWDRFESTYFQATAEQCFRDYPEADGVFGTDLLVMYFARTALAAGKKIPADLKVVAYDGTYILDVMCPTLTAVVQPIEGLAKAGVEQLMLMIGGEKAGAKEVKLSVELRYGVSTEKNDK